MRISDWCSDVCSSDLDPNSRAGARLTANIRRSRRPVSGSGVLRAKRCQPLIDDRLGVGDDPVDQLFAGRNVVNQALNHAGPEYALRKIAGLQTFTPGGARAQSQHVAELGAGLQIGLGAWGERGSE